MKTPFPLILLSIALGLMSCNVLQTIQRPISNGGSFNPLMAPVNQSSSQVLEVTTTEDFTPGQWIETSMPNTTFFTEIPKADATADKVLQVGSSMKYISSKESYVRVELDSGDLGYIPKFMVDERSATPSLPNIPAPITPAAPPIPDKGEFVPVAPGQGPSSTLPEVSGTLAPPDL